MLMPTKWAVSPSSLGGGDQVGRLGDGTSAHQEPQTLTTVGLPRKSARSSGLPSRSSPVELDRVVAVVGVDDRDGAVAATT